MTTVLNHVFRLRAWTVRKYKDRYYISGEDHPKNWRRSYKTLHHACTAIARKHEEEWTSRAERYGVR